MRKQINHNTVTALPGQDHSARHSRG